MSRPLKVAMVAACPFPFPRGTPIRIYRMAEALSKRGHDVHVVTYHLGEPAPDAPFHIHRVAKIPTYKKTSPGPGIQKLILLDPLLTLKLRGLLRRESFDVIHAHHVEGLLVANAARSGSHPPVVFDVHTLLESELPHYDMGLPSKMKRWVGRAFDRWLPGRADHIIGVTDDIRSRLVESAGVRDEDISVIPNGVETRPFAVRTPSPPRNGGDRKLIFTGNLAPYQGIDLMLEAFSLVRSRRGDVRLLIATEDSFTPYEKRASDLGVRSFIDLHTVDFSQVPALLRGADIALNPRVGCDGLPQKLLNYMAAGRAVVSFAGSAKHLVHGENGVVVADSDTEAFARAIDELLADTARAARLGAAAEALVHERLSWDATAEKVERVYHRLG